MAGVQEQIDALVDQLKASQAAIDSLGKRADAAEARAVVLDDELQHAADPAGCERHAHRAGS